MAPKSRYQLVRGFWRIEYSGKESIPVSAGQYHALVLV
jgi:hypothetical protein